MSKDKSIIEPIDASLDEVVDLMMGESSPKQAIEKFAEITKDSQLSGGSKELGFVKEGECQLFEFRKKPIRSIFHNNEWLFSVVDVVQALTEHEDYNQAKTYWSTLKNRLKKEGSEVVTDCEQLKLPASDGKRYRTDCANAEAMFRIIQSIPSKKAEAIKRWLAKVGFERIQEEQDPELAIKRAMLSYKAKGYDDKWVNARLQTITSRKELTSEWAKRGVKEGIEYATLTNVISKKTFDKTTNEHQQLKGLKKHQNLRDHMTPLELALTMLGEATTAELARTTDAQGFNENKDAAIEGGQVAGGARKNIEKKLGRPVVTRENYLPESKQKKLGNDQ